MSMRFLSARAILAITAIVLLVTSEVLSPYYGASNLKINKQRLKNSHKGIDSVSSYCCHKNCNNCLWHVVSIMLSARANNYSSLLDVTSSGRFLIDLLESPSNS
jgi:hypothetical protein